MNPPFTPAFGEPWSSRSPKGGRCEEIGSMVYHVIPAEAGIQDSQGDMDILDSGFHRSDAQTAIFSQRLGKVGHALLKGGGILS